MPVNLANLCNMTFTASNIFTSHWYDPSIAPTGIRTPGSQHETDNWPTAISLPYNITDSKRQCVLMVERSILNVFIEIKHYFVKINLQSSTESYQLITFANRHQV